MISLSILEGQRTSCRGKPRFGDKIERILFRSNRGNGGNCGGEGRGGKEKEKGNRVPGYLKISAHPVP